MTPEVELLLCCARLKLDEARISQLKSLVSQEIQWDRVLTVANRHGLMPLVYWHVTATVPTAVPATLREAFHAHAKQNLFLSGELVKILCHLDSTGVRAIAFKGPVLAETLYGNLALRQFDDLDIVIDQRDFDRARNALHEIGLFPPTNTDSRTIVRCDYECSFAPADNSYFMEVQWAFAPPYFPLRLTPDDLWTRLEPITFANSTIATFRREDLVLLLCLHGAKHLWGRLEWITTVAELMHQPLDWDAIRKQTTTLGCDRIVRLGTHLATSVLDAPMPDDFRADPLIKAIATDIQENMFCDSARISPLTMCRFHMRVRERFLDRIRHACRFLLYPTLNDVQTLWLPTPLFPIYGIVRPFRLLLKYGTQG